VVSGKITPELAANRMFRCQWTHDKAEEVTHMAKYSLQNQNGKSDEKEVMSISRQNPEDRSGGIREIRDMNGKSRMDSETYSISNQNGEG
jgi:hypothetical protein